MTKELRRVIEIIAKALKSHKKILEIGSRAAINQEEICNLRELFPQSKYLGIDMQSGPGVDLVVDAETLPFDKNTFDLVICLETLEHASNPWLIVQEAERVCKKSGVILLSSQQNFPLHLHPMDYFRYTPYGLAALIQTFSQRILLGIAPAIDREAELNPKHVVGIFWNANTVNKQKMKRALKSNESFISGHKPYRHRVQEFFKIMRRAFWELKFRHELKFFE